MNLKIKLTLLVLLLINITLMAQSSYTLSGVVVSKNDNAPIPGVTIIIEGTFVGTSSDIDGKYQLEVTKGAIVKFSYVGFVSQLVTISNQKEVNIALEEDFNQLDEVVVIGYGTVKKANLTGSISKVVNENLDQIPIARIDDALIGQVAGVNIQMTNPAAGEAPTIKIRGQGSISFNSNPLIVVDGIAVGTDADFLSSIDMNDVQSIEILKDASSSAIYGSRGANGIVMITTKEGKEGPTKFSYNAYTGFKSVTRTGVLADMNDWFAYELATNGVLSDRATYIQKMGTYTNWEDVMMNGGMIQSHSLSAKGGTKNTKFNSSLSFLDDGGVLLTDNYKKINLRLNLTTKVSDRVEFGIVLNPSYTEQRRFPVGIHDAIRQSPWLPIYLDENNIQFVNRYRENGRWADAQVGDYAMERMFDDYDLVNGMPSSGSGTDISATSNQGAYAKVVERKYMKYQTKLFGNAFLKVKLADNLFFKQSIGGDFRLSKNEYWTGVTASRNGAADSNSERNETVQYHSVAESVLNFSKQVGNHTIDAVAGFAYENWNIDYAYIEGSGYNNDYIQTIPAANLIGAETAKYQENLISYLSRLNYSYADKYLVSLSARFDGSSKFGPDNKFGFFPAASFGWRVTNEEFLKDNRVVSDLKLRASYGNTGSNAGIGYYDYIGLITPVGTGLSGSPVGFNASNISNSELRWEKLVEFNPGIDASFYNGRFSVSFDYYVRTSKDLLLDLPIPSITGFETALVNKGVVENKGFELELVSRIISKSDFTWKAAAMFTHNKNTLIDFAGASGLISTVDDKRPAEWIAVEGQPIASYYGYVVSKEIELDYIKNPFYPIGGQSQDIYVKDLNGDGLIDGDDRTILGSPYPDLVWSLSNNLTYKNFDLSFMIQGSHGAEVRNIDSQYINNEFASNQDSDTDLPNPEFTTQRIFTSDDIQDASYVALRNLNIGYTIPSRLLDKFNIRKLRVYVGAQNLLYFMTKNYTGYNPEGINRGLDSPLTYGYQNGPAPIYRTISLGLNLEF